MAKRWQYMTGCGITGDAYETKAEADAAIARAMERRRSRTEDGMPVGDPPYLVERTTNDRRFVIADMCQSDRERIR